MFRAILKINDIPYDLSTTTNEKVDKKTESVKKSGHSPALLYTFLKYCLSIRHLWFLFILHRRPPDISLYMVSSPECHFLLYEYSP